MGIFFGRRKVVTPNSSVVPVPVHGPDQLAVDRAQSMFVSSNPVSPMSRGIYQGQPGMLSGDRGSGEHAWKGGMYVEGHNVTPQNFYSAVRPQANPLETLIGLSSLPNTGNLTELGASGTASSVALMGLGQSKLGLGN